MTDISAAGLKRARRLGDRKVRVATGQFLVEGAQAVREAVRYGTAKRVLATDLAARTWPELVADGYDRLTDDQVRVLADTLSPPGIFAVCALPSYGLGDIFNDSSRLVVCCHRVRDPGNLGTVIRCADAFGADGVVVTTDSVEVTNPKTVRASAGSVFHLPVVAGVRLADVVDRAHDTGMRVLAADASGEDIDQLAAAGGLDGPVMWLMGNEAWGLDGDELMADKVVRIPMPGQAESLNLSTAAAICLFTSRRSV